jgi:hypothetical protein
MNRYILIRRLRWPAILLLIGIVALLERTGAIDHFWHLFFPLLLILLGVMLLAERAALAMDGDNPGYPGTPYPGTPYPGAPYAGPADPAAGAVPAQYSAPASTAIVPANSTDIEIGSNGGQS